MRTRALILVAALSAPLARAADVKQSWPTIAGAQNYEFEIAIDPDFEPNQLVRQGLAKEPRVDTELPGGIYFLRVRAVLDGNRPGEWSKPRRFVVKSGSVRFLSPKNHERIELATGEEPVFFEWTPADGAQYYELEFRELKTGRTLKKTTTSTAVPVADLGPGMWEIRLAVYAGKQVVAESEALRLDLLPGDKLRIEPLQPQEGDVVAAFEKTRIRWKRAEPIHHSTIEIKKVGATRAQLIKVDGAPESWLPALEPGDYQITLREGKLERSFGIRVEQDPFNERRSRLGVTWRILSLAPVFGHASSSNYLLPQGVGVEGREGARFGSRIQTFLTEKWGFEGSLNSEIVDYEIKDSSASFKLGDFSGPTGGSAAGALLYRQKLKGIHRQVIYKGLLKYRLVRQHVKDPSDSGNELSLSNFSVLSIGAGAEFELGGWNRYWDLDMGGEISFPLLHEAGALLGSGAPKFFTPSLEAEILLRRRIAKNWRAFVGSSFGLDLVQISESRAAPGASNTKFSWLWIGPRFGVEWDL